MQIMGILAALAIIGFIILIHEFGHYLVGKLSRCSVSQFSIGWGPKLISFKKKETDYRISWLPFIGGYVRMPGMEGESAELTEEEAKDIKKYNLKTFEEIRTWQKFLVFVGGVGMQIITCALILTLVVSILGKPVTKVVVLGVMPGSPAEEAGLEKLDKIIKVDGKKISSGEELRELTAQKAGKIMLLTVKREDELKELQVMPEYSQKDKRALIGISFSPIDFIDFEKDDMKWHDYLFGGIVFTGMISKIVIKTLGWLITAKVPLNAVSGPVGIVAATKNVMTLGFLTFLIFLANININLAIINLLPFPALDGGHVLFLSIEKIFRFKIKPKIKEVITMAGFAILIGLVLLVTYNDIRGLFYAKDISREPEKVEMKK